MGKRGPKPTPTKTLENRGSWRAKKREGEPILELVVQDPDTGELTCPTWLSKEAKRAWKELAPQLQEAGLLAIVDQNALARYCEIWVQWRKAMEFIDKNGQVYEGPGGTRPWPQVQIAHKGAAELSRLEQSFGLTPSARVGLTVTKVKDKKNSKDRFFENAG